MNALHVWDLLSSKHLEGTEGQSKYQFFNKQIEAIVFVNPLLHKCLTTKKVKSKKSKVKSKNKKGLPCNDNPFYFLIFTFELIPQSAFSSIQTDRLV